MRPRGLIALACTCSLVALISTARAQTSANRTFASAEAAAKTLVGIVKQGDLDGLLAVFGPDGKELSNSSDPAAARQSRQVFSIAAREQWHLVDEGPDRKTLVIGYEDWPFPIPLVKAGTTWQFDTAAGKEEVLARRIGQNELSTIATCHAYVTAQRRYAERGHDGAPAGVYARSFQSQAGKEDGLYWPTAKGQPRSPLGDLVAQAAIEGRALNAGQPAPLNGYYYRILTAQGANATGGALNYIVSGKMSKGFAMVAWPAQYDVTGIMTFLVNQDGIVYEKDLGPDGAKIAQGMTSFNPDATWHPSE